MISNEIENLLSPPPATNDDESMHSPAFLKARFRRKSVRLGLPTEDLLTEATFTSASAKKSNELDMLSSAMLLSPEGTLSPFGGRMNGFDDFKSPDVRRQLFADTTPTKQPSTPKVDSLTEDMMLFLKIRTVEDSPLVSSSGRRKTVIGLTDGLPTDLDPELPFPMTPISKRARTKLAFDDDSMRSPLRPPLAPHTTNIPASSQMSRSVTSLEQLRQQKKVGQVKPKSNQKVEKEFESILAQAQDRLKMVEESRKRKRDATTAELKRLRSSLRMDQSDKLAIGQQHMKINSMRANTQKQQQQHQIFNLQLNQDDSNNMQFSDRDMPTTPPRSMKATSSTPTKIPIPIRTTPSKLPIQRLSFGGTTAPSVATNVNIAKRPPLPRASINKNVTPSKVTRQRMSSSSALVSPRKSASDIPTGNTTAMNRFGFRSSTTTTTNNAGTRVSRGSTLKSTAVVPKNSRSDQVLATSKIRRSDRLFGSRD